MPYFGSQNSENFASGTVPTPVSGHANVAPVAPVAPVATGQDDGAYEDYQRDQGSYTPGTYPRLEDQLGQGSDDNAA